MGVELGLGARWRRGCDFDCRAYVFVEAGGAEEVGIGTLGSGAGSPGAGGVWAGVPGVGAVVSGAMPAAQSAKMVESVSRATRWAAVSEG